MSVDAFRTILLYIPVFLFIFVEKKRIKEKLTDGK